MGTYSLSFYAELNLWYSSIIKHKLRIILGSKFEKFKNIGARKTLGILIKKECSVQLLILFLSHMCKNDNVKENSKWLVNLLICSQTQFSEQT